MRVESANNERLRDVARLASSSHERRKSGRCVLEGVHLIEIYCERVGPPQTLVVLDEALARRDIINLMARVPASRTLVVRRALFSELASLPADVSALAVVPAPVTRASEPGRFCLVLEDVQDPGNVGTMIRTAAAAGVDQVLLSRDCAFAWAPKALRAGQGAHFLTTVIERVDLRAWIDAFRAAGGRAFATVVADAIPVYRADLRGRVAIAVGNEGSGLSPALQQACDARIAIPMASGSESLNAAAAGAVVL
ncbi:MAG TPA: RNA methyltransferase, partial [Casimicrobiaceae bacterium]|nr:RNA methyltransferase [Casimicrobiaceae bacterium]